MTDVKKKLDAVVTALSALENDIKNTDCGVPWDILEMIDTTIKESNDAGNTLMAQLYENTKHIMLADPDLVYRGDDDSYDVDDYEDDDEEYDDEEEYEEVEEED